MAGPTHHGKAKDRATVEALLQAEGHTYAEDAGIKMKNTPQPLYQALVAACLLSARIKASVATAAAHELFTAGMRSPRRMCEATWQQRVDALGKGHYRRYDERTATQLGEARNYCSTATAETCGDCATRRARTRTNCAGPCAGSRGSARSAWTSSCARCRRSGRR